jgi:hypothetical protein
MTEQQDASQLIAEAERAAAAGDFESTHELLQRAVRRQENDLGPLHPDLANTLNNLAVVAERTGRVSEAEPLYRRAAAIAKAAFAADHPMVVESQQNLEDFCRAHGLSVVAPEAVPQPTVPQPVPPLPAAPRPHPGAAVSPASRPSEPVQSSPRRSGWLVVVAGGVVVLMIAALLVSRSGRPGDGSPSGQAPAAAAKQPAEPVASPPVPPSSASPTRAEQGRGVPNATIDAQLCRTFSTNGRNWRCDPIGESVSAGRLVLYTRIRSARNGAVVHRWYRGGTLRQSVTLPTRASASDGYRTYSRQTVNAGDWRVEVRSTDGALLHEQRFVVR